MGLDPIDIVALVLIGGLVTIVAHQLALGRVEPSYRFAAVWSAWSACVVASFWACHLASTDWEVSVTSRVLYAVIAAGLPAGLLLAQSLHGSAKARRRWLALAVSVMVIPVLLQQVLPVHVVSVDDVFTGRLQFTTVGAAGAIIAVPAIPVVVHVVGLLRASPRRPRVRVARLMVVALSLAAVNDVLVLAVGLPSLLLLPFVIGSQAIALHLLIVTESSALFRDLEAAVATRTEEIAEQRTELRRSIENLHTLMSGLPDGVIAVDGDVIVFANRAATRLTQTPVEKLIGASLAERLPPADRERIGASIAEAIASSEPRGPVELRLRSSGTNVVEIELVALGVLFEGKPIGLVILHDVSERVRMREQLLRSDRLASLGTLIAGIGHEINNPLTYLMGNLEVIVDELRADRPVPAISRSELADIAGEAYGGGQRIGTIVRDMREFARPDVAEVTEVDLCDVVADALKLTRHTLEHRAKLVSDLEPASTRGNRSRFVQVIVNLLVNAIQAVRNGPGAEIRVVTRVVDGEARIEVHDNGIGMSRDVIQRAFDPFFTTKPVGTGTGLGLSVCHGIATAYGGRVELDSVENEGTIASLVMPATQPAIAPVPVSLPAIPCGTTVPKAPSRRARLLIIDDDANVVRTLRRMLREHDVEIATNLAEVEATLHRGPFDLVLCDLMMPDMTGMELHAKLERDAPTIATRMMFMTGGAFTPDALAFVEQMGPRCLLKPLTTAHLRKVIRGALDADGGGIQTDVDR